MKPNTFLSFSHASSLFPLDGMDHNKMLDDGRCSKEVTPKEKKKKIQTYSTSYSFFLCDIILFSLLDILSIHLQKSCSSLLLSKEKQKKHIIRDFKISLCCSSK
jgi:hypothetical protein